MPKIAPNVPVIPSAQLQKTLTFAGGAGTGNAGTMTALTVTGKVLVKSLVFVCATDLTTSGAATIACGVVGTTSGFIAATTATTIDAGLIWVSTTATTGLLALPAICKDIIVTTDIIFTIASANITGGSLVVTVNYEALSAGAGLS